MSPEPDEAEQRIALSRAFVFVSLITLAAAIIRSLNLSESLWVDELHTGWVVLESWSDVAERARPGNQSPLWFYAVKLIVSLLGPSEFSLRFLSFLAGTALVPSVYFLARKLNCGRSHIGALAAAAIVAVDHACVFYSSEARPYACVQLTAAWQLFVFLEVCERPSNRNRFTLIGLTALAFHLHSTAILIVLGEAAYLLGCYFSRRPVPYRFYLASCDTFLGLPLLLAALPQLRELAERRGMWSGMVGRPEWIDLWTIFPLWPAVCGLIFAAIFLIINRERTPLPRLGSLLAWFFVPILFAWWATLFDYAALFFGRYLVSLTIGPALIAAFFVSLVHRDRIRVVLAIALFGLALYQSEIVPQVMEDGHAVGDRNEDWRGAIAYVNSKASKDSNLAVYSGLIEESTDGIYPTRFYLNQYLMFSVRSLYPVNVPEARTHPLVHGFRSSEHDALPQEYWIIGRCSESRNDPVFDWSIAIMQISPIKGPKVRTELRSTTSFRGINVYRFIEDRVPTSSPNTNPTPPDPQ